MYFVAIGTLLTLAFMMILTNETNNYIIHISTTTSGNDTRALIATTDHKNTRKSIEYTPFAICSSYWEGQTNALFNMWSLQKFAKISGFRVTQPFVNQSTLGLTDQLLNHYNFTNVLHFSDYFDLDFWTTKTEQNYKIPPLAKWNEFAFSPFKKTVVVILVYEILPPGVYINDDINKNHGCFNEKTKFYNKHARLFDKLQIEVLRNVCFAFYPRKHYFPSLQVFNSYFRLNNSTNVWFSDWRGIHTGRIGFSNHKELERCHEGKERILSMVKTSSRIIQDSRKYVNTVLNRDFNEYTAVAVRTTNRKTALVKKGYSIDGVFEHFQKCAEQLKYVLLKMNSSNNFLSIDLGRFGDLTNANYFKINNTGSKLFNLILKTVYGTKSIDDYHNDLIRSANGIEDSGYIGSMQKTIAYNAKRLIVVGGYSSFQRSMILNFKVNKPHCKDCITYICYNKLT